MDVQSVLTSAARDAIARPTGEAAGLPNDAYTSADFMQLERERLFARTWTCVGVASKLKGAGRVIPVSALGAPIIVLRDRDGAVRAFHNVCSHRGTLLVKRPRRVRDLLRCPYHGWCYDLDGSLRATPDIGGPGIDETEGFDRAAHGLKPVRCGVWADMIFVNLDGAAPPLEDDLAPLIERWAAYDFTLLRHGGKSGGSTSLALNANWKLAVENYCESYHLPVVHPGLNRYSRLDDHYHIMIGERFAGQGTRAYRPLPVGGATLTNFPNLSTRETEGAEYVALYPNVLLGVQADHFYCVVLEPVAPDRTVEHVEIYYVGANATDESLAAAREATLERWRRVFVEDIGIVERLQQGRASPGFAGGCFSPVMDPPSHHFHRWVVATLMA